ncbi:class I SAM-dependent methyltransferase [Nocardioides sp.]|uniref:class I SAM-dependent methyltransferase n=1 Tax=Nocardioides sp. TaxID=35761 RepID=UPI002B265A7E|nr:class I SAM-dependent methyltransferase [Nocardioides sp.]
MGRYSRQLAPLFADWSGVVAGQEVLDVGCGPGALTEVLIARLGLGAVVACDPSESFVADCRARFPGLDVRTAAAEDLPVSDGSCDVVLAQLVLHFVSDPARAAAEFRRVLRPGGTAAACSWDLVEGMAMLRHFWDAAISLDPAAPAEATLKLGGPGELPDLFAAAGFVDVSETTFTVTATYTSYDELWSGFLEGIGPAGAYAVRQSPERQEALREALFVEVGSPAGSFELEAVARAGLGC